MLCRGWSLLDKDSGLILSFFIENNLRQKFVVNFVPDIFIANNRAI